MPLYSHLFLRNTTSPYGDVTRNSVLSFNDLDQNFIFLKERDINNITYSSDTLTINTLGGNSFNTTILNTNTYVTGGTYNPSTIQLDFEGNSGFTPFSVDVSQLTDTYVNSGIYNPSTGCVTFETTSGFTFDVCGFVTGFTQYWTSGSSGNFSVKVINDTTTDATGDYSHAEGRNTLASGSYSHAEGWNTVASGDGSSHAEGSNTTASGIKGSHAEGESTIASGAASHSQNSNTIAAGNDSHAGGAYSTASGDTSFIHSKNSLVSGDRSVVLGGQNITGTTDDTVYVPYLNIRDLGTGTSVNNLGIDASGNVVVGSTSGSTSVSTYWTEQNSGLKDVNGSHTIGGTSTLSIIAGGAANNISDTVVGGILGGYDNTIDRSNGAVILGGESNEINVNSQASLIFGVGNTITNGSNQASILGGTINTIDNGDFSSILGGTDNNIIGDDSDRSTIIGGSGNTISNVENSVILGGSNITANTSNTVYVPYLNIQEVPTGTSVNNLGIDASGNVVIGTSGLTSGSGTTPYDMSFAISDEITQIISGTSAITLFAPRSFTLTNVKASLSTSGSSTTEIDIKVNGVSILSTNITIDSGDKRSVDATTPPVISSSSITEDDEITVDIVTAGTDAAGAKIYLIGQV